MTPQGTIEREVVQSVSARDAGITDDSSHRGSRAIPLEHCPRRIAQFVLLNGEIEIHNSTVVPISMR
jgi:hypothetical protein